MSAAGYVRVAGRSVLIIVKKLNERAFWLKAEQIQFVEETPDTLITLINGNQIVVKETIDEVITRAVEYARSIRAFPV